MIMIHDTINRVPYTEVRTCDFHKKHPGKSFAGCTCSCSMGFRPATPDEKRQNLERAKRELQEQIEELEAQKKIFESMITE